MFVAHPFNKFGLKGESQYADGQYRYRVDDVAGQVDSYLEEGYPDIAKNVLISGAFVYNAWDSSVRKLMRAWWKEIMTRSIQCQISLPYVLWREFRNFSIDAVYKILPDTRDICNKILHPDDTSNHGGYLTNWYGRCFYDHGNVSPLDAIDVNLWCSEMQKAHNIQPYIDWGSLPKALHVTWRTRRCDQYIHIRKKNHLNEKDYLNE
jgi:hypothetical protein